MRIVIALASLLALAACASGPPAGVTALQNAECKLRASEHDDNYIMVYIRCIDLARMRRAGLH